MIAPPHCLRESGELAAVSYAGVGTVDGRDKFCFGVDRITARTEQGDVSRRSIEALVESTGAGRQEFDLGTGEGTVGPNHVEESVTGIHRQHKRPPAQMVFSRQAEGAGDIGAFEVGSHFDMTTGITHAFGPHP